MPIELFRIDERLLHGQVVVGWGKRLGIDYYVVADDDLAAAGWEQELYRSGLPEDTEAAFLTVDEAVASLEEWDDRAGTGALLTPGTEEMRRLAEADLLRDRAVNVGCLSDAPDRRRATDYVHLRPREREDLKSIAERAGPVAARDLPGARQISLEEVLDALDGD